MSDQNEPQHSVPIKQHSQKVSIRKITLETIGPVIQKLEQHIGYLLQQSTQLRLSIKFIQATASDHKIVHQKLDETSHRTEQLEARVSDYNLYNNKKFVEIDSQFNEVKAELERLRAMIKKKGQQINQLEDTIKLNYNTQSQKIQQNGRDILQTSLKLNITNQDFKHTIQNQQFRLNSIQRDIDLAIKRLEATSSNCSENTSSLQLYMVDRQELRQDRQRIWDKLLKTIDKQQYQYDKRVYKLQNQALKQDVIKNIDSVLTPQVKAFMPIMLQKVAQIEKLDAVINKVNETQKTVKLQQNLLEAHANSLQNFQSKTNQIDETFSSYMKQLQSIQDQLKADLNTHDHRIVKCDEKINTVQSQTNLHFKENQSLISTIQTKNKMELISVKQKISEDLAQFIGNHKQDIYKVVQQLVPEDQRKFEEYLRQIVPTISETKTLLLNRCDEIQSLGQGLDKKIEAFSFKITKIKGDVEMLSGKILKENSQIKAKIQDFKIKCQLIGKIMSEISEIMLIVLASNITPGEQEVYVTYNDGIILQYLPNIDKSKLYYRKNKIYREQLMKATLKSFLQSIDNIIVTNELQFLNWKAQKPSDFYQKQVIPIYKVIEQTNNLQFKYAQKGSTKRIDKSTDKLDQQFSNQPQTSRTIDFSQGRKKNSSLNQTTDFKKSYNVRLKKIDKNEKDRYNISKQDVQ